MRHVLWIMFWHWKVTKCHGFFARIGDEILETGSSLIWSWVFRVVPYSSWNNQLRIRTLWIPWIFFYRPQRSCGKVMFLHLSVLGGGFWADTPLGQTHPPLGRPPPGKHSPPGRRPLLCSACWDTVNKRAVRILLECNLVT